MRRMVKSLVLASAVLVAGAPAFAAPTNLTVGHLNFNPLGLDLDPFHLFTPAHPHHRFHHHKMAMKHKMMKHMAKKK